MALRLKDHQLHAKKDKCAFAQGKVEYLGHIISGGVEADPNKVKNMVNRPLPQTVTKHRVFLD